MVRLKIVEPRSDTPSIRFGEKLTVVVDLELDEPWFPAPEHGRRLTQLDGEPALALAFDTGGPSPIRTLVSGRAEARDSGVDDRSGPPLRSIRGGLGLEVTIRSGEMELVYSHLKRSNPRTGRVKAGDIVGTSGNTGRCLSGEKGSFVKVAAKRAGSPARIDDFTTPITVETKVNGTSVGRPFQVPAGEVECLGLRLDPVVVSVERPDPFRSGENQVDVTVKRGSRVLASQGVATPLAE